MCSYIKSLNPEIPLHFTRFRPEYKMKKIAPTPVQKIEEAYRIAKSAGLKYVYVDNFPGHPNANTVYPSCGTLLIDRYHFKVLKNYIKDGHCPECGISIPGVWV